MQSAIHRKSKPPESDTLSPARLINKLAEELRREVSDISFDYFTMHNATWSLLTELKEEFTRIVGPSFLQYVPYEDKLPYVVGFTFSAAAGRTGLKADEVAEPNPTFMNASAKILSGFLENGKGRQVKEDASKQVEHEEVANLEFDGQDPWPMKKLMADIEKMARAHGGMNGGDCAMQ